jgi:hypothetical protein
MNPTATKTAKTLATYATTTLRQWAVSFTDGVIETVWASSKSQAIALATEKRQALGNGRQPVSHAMRM